MINIPKQIPKNEVWPGCKITNWKPKIVFEIENTIKHLIEKQKKNSKNSNNGKLRIHIKIKTKLNLHELFVKSSQPYNKTSMVI
jgi:hypothetical protein